MSDPTPSSSQHASQWRFVFAALDEAASVALAADIADNLAPGDCLALDGDLGLGKSTFARALLRARARDGALEVPSPTFTLVQEYRLADLDISHFDLYRISDVEELYEIGFEESFAEGCALVEWPERAEDLMPPEALWLTFAPGPDDMARQLTLSGPASWGARLLRLCEKRQLLIDSGWGGAWRKPIAGDLSPRGYDRILWPDVMAGFAGAPDGEEDSLACAKRPAPSAILMDMPERQPGPELTDGRLYDVVAHRVTQLAPMVTIREGLEHLGLRVPQAYGVALKKGLMLWEDFGSETLAASPESPIDSRYMATVTALAALHRQLVPDVFGGSGGYHALSPYDRDAFAVELDVFLDHFWPHVKGALCPDAERQDFHALWAPLLHRLETADQVLVLRDVQDPNCYWLQQADGSHEVGFIDFQDCLIGPDAYDLSALAMDARVTIPDTLRDQMLDHYSTLRGFDSDQRTRFEASFCLCAAQRISKNLGAFARAANQALRRDYLDHVPRSLTYLRFAVDHPLLSSVKDWYISRGLL